MLTRLWKERVLFMSLVTLSFKVFIFDVFAGSDFSVKTFENLLF